MAAAPSLAHDIRQNDIVTQVIKQRGERWILVTQYSQTEAVEVLVDCDGGVADFEFDNRDYLIHKRNSDGSWTSTWKDGRSFDSDKSPSVYTFACHTH